MTRVERIEDGRKVEYTEQSDIERVVREETQTRFLAAKCSPFCQGVLGEQLGYISDTSIALEILERRYPPPEVSDATALLIDEIGRVGQQITRNGVPLTISPEEYSQYWGHVKEGASSSISGLHFGHYIAASKDKLLTRIFTKKMNLVTSTGSAPSRWGVGLSVLLEMEKVAGIALVNKLRAILLMEADFNMHNRFVFGDRMMELARSEGLIPDEQFAEKQSDGQDGVFMKKLVTDYSRQMKVPMGVVSADAASEG